MSNGLRNRWKKKRENRDTRFMVPTTRDPGSTIQKGKRGALTAFKSPSDRQTVSRPVLHLYTSSAPQKRAGKLRRPSSPPQTPQIRHAANQHESNIHGIDNPQRTAKKPPTHSSTTHITTHEQAKAPAVPPTKPNQPTKSYKYNSSNRIVPPPPKHTAPHFTGGSRNLGIIILQNGSEQASKETRGGVR